MSIHIIKKSHKKNIKNKEKSPSQYQLTEKDVQSMYDVFHRLVLIVEKGFDTVATKVEAHEIKQMLTSELKKIEKRLSRIEFYANGHERKIAILEERLQMLSERQERGSENDEK